MSHVLLAFSSAMVSPVIFIFKVPCRYIFLASLVYVIMHYVFCRI